MSLAKQVRELNQFLDEMRVPESEEHRTVDPDEVMADLMMQLLGNVLKATEKLQEAKFHADEMRVPESEEHRTVDPDKVMADLILQHLFDVLKAIEKLEEAKRQAESRISRDNPDRGVKGTHELKGQIL